MHIKFCIIVIQVLFCTFSIWAHDGAHHEREILAVLGINGAKCTGNEVQIFDIPDNVDAKKRIHPTLEVFRDCIDRDATNNALYNSIKEVMQPYHFTYDPNGKKYGHRVFFHWGFNTNPKESKALCECFDNATKDMQIQEKGWKLVLEEQGRRNRKIYKSINKLSPVPRKQRNAFATLVYDVHILGDFIEGKSGPVSAMIPLDALIEDIAKHAIGNFDCKDTSLKNELQKKIRAFRRQSADQQLVAKRVLVFLITNVPGLIAKTTSMKRLVWGNEDVITSVFLVTSEDGPKLWPSVSPVENTVEQNTIPKQ